MSLYTTPPPHTWCSSPSLDDHILAQAMGQTLEITHPFVLPKPKQTTQLLVALSQGKGNSPELCMTCRAKKPLPGRWNCSACQKH